MFYFLSYCGDGIKESGCPIWCDVSFPAFDGTSIEAEFSRGDMQALTQLHGHNIMFHEKYIDFDFFDAHRGLVIVSEKFVGMLASLRTNVGYVEINAQVKPSKNSAAIALQSKRYFLLLVNTTAYCVDVLRSEIRARRQGDGRLVRLQESPYGFDIEYVYRLVVDDSNAPAQDIFAPKELKYKLLATDDFLICARAQGLKGVSLTPTPDCDLLDLPSLSGDKRIIDNGVAAVFFPTQRKPVSRLP